MWENARKRCLNWAWLMLNLFHHLTFAASKLIHRPTLHIFLTHQYTSCVSCDSWVATGGRAPARTGYTQWFTNFCLSLVCPDTRLYCAWHSAYSAVGMARLAFNSTVQLWPHRDTHIIYWSELGCTGLGCVEGATCTHSSFAKLFGTDLLSSIYTYIYILLSIYIYICTVLLRWWCNTRLQRITQA